MSNTANEKILYIEDEPIIGSLFKASVEAHGYDVVVSATGKEGLRLATENSFGLVAVDYELPDMTGMEVSRRLLEENPLLPILMVTGKGNERLAVEAMSLGVSHYVAKDDKEVYMEKIPAIISHLLGNAALKRQHEQTLEALKESEARFRDFSDSTSDWIWEMDENLRFSSVSDRYSEISGVNASLILGKTFEESGLDMSDPAVAQNAEDLSAHRPFRNFEYSRTLHTGRKLHISLSGKPYFTADGSFRGYRGTGSDITERVEMEERLLRSQRMEAIGQLTSGVAHDFNNLMAVMMGNAEILEVKLRGSSDEIQQRLTAIRKAVEHGSTLTHRLLSFSRQQILIPEVLHVARHVAGLGEILNDTLADGIELEIQADGSEWTSTIDQHQFESALNNLALNACDAMPDGGQIQITVSDINLDESPDPEQDDFESGEYIKIAFSDTGTGMTDEVLGKVF